MLHQCRAISPFIVIPRKHFNQIAINDFGEFQINDPLLRFADNVGRNNVFFNCFKIPCQRDEAALPNILLISSTEVFLLEIKVISAIDPTTGTYCYAVKLPFKLFYRASDGNGGAGG